MHSRAKETVHRLAHATANNTTWFREFWWTHHPCDQMSRLAKQFTTVFYSISHNSFLRWQFRSTSFHLLSNNEVKWIPATPLIIKQCDHIKSISDIWWTIIIIIFLLERCQAIIKSSEITLTTLPSASWLSSKSYCDWRMKRWTHSQRWLKTWDFRKCFIRLNEAKESSLEWRWNETLFF